MRTALVVLVVVVLVGALYAGRVLVARAHDRPVLAASSPGAVGGVVARASPTFAGSPSGPAAGGAAPMTSAPETSGTVVVVDVVGQVRHPGVYRLRSGQRVDDAVRAAGGVVSPCDVAAVNLARPLLDGEQIRVPRPGESVVAAPLPGGSTSGGSASGGSASGGSTPGGSATVLVNLNAAGLSDLDALPGVGPVLAQRILDWRAAHGRFTAVDELGEVAGIGEKLLSQLRPKVSVRGP